MQKNTTALENLGKIFSSLGGLIITGCFLIICCLFLYFFIFSPDPRTVDEYMKRYGGNPDVYERILDGTDCTVLQTEFDQAYENSQGPAPGTPQHKWSTGYMTAADQRMKEIGCYK